MKMAGLAMRIAVAGIDLEQALNYTDSDGLDLACSTGPSPILG